jgi:competence protein ComEC
MLGAGSFSFLNDDYFLYPLFIGFFVVTFLLILFWSKLNTRFILVLGLFFILGALRFLVAFPVQSPEHLRYFNGRPVVVTGYVSVEPDVRIGETQYVVNVKRITENKIEHSVAGKVLVKNRSYPAFQYGDRLSVKCLLEAPFVADEGTFRYDKYLARQDIWSVCNHPLITVEAGEGGSVVMEYILSFKARVGTQLTRLWTEPEASFMAGLLYGSKSGLPTELTTNFSRTGVTHIIAVSGFNITIIGTVLASIFMIVGLSRRRAFWCTLGIIFLFVIFTGASASVVRAGIMGGLVLIARQLGRLSRISNVLVFTAAVMTLLNPYVLVWDIGFQLSFLATLGLVYISPVLQSVILTRRGGEGLSEKSNYLMKGILRFVQNDKPEWVVGLYETFIATLSAIIATLPLILFQFGRLSTVAPLVNVLVLWCIPWLMLLGFVSLMLSFVYFPLGQVIAWIASVGLKYVILVVTFFGEKSWASLDFGLPWWGMVGMYAVLFVVIARSIVTKHSP